MKTRINGLGRLWVCGGMILWGAVSCSTPAGRPTGLELFNGKDLADWKSVLADPAVPMDQVWSVQDGILTCQGTPLGFLYREPAAGNFRLAVEYRWPPGHTPGNSGIFTRLNAPFSPLPCAVEVQLKYGNAGDVFGLQGKPIARGQPRFFEIRQHPEGGDIAGISKLLEAENPPGEWNRVEILARGERYRVWLNGKLVNDVSGVHRGAGLIGLQSEGGVIQFRRVTLQPLD
ncbi:MAG TPA: DUF1080 domain-containing protein [Verrucomicrobiota bacterium]|nr:DUF1080 domain-containing protein [Verrucomicrobiota bacterium]HPW92633.1 DUF1080 domain-containing protein [Verrucomicrobiota bacterium]HQB73347.1 DUF1080 domain-containing protein [Verrucomicrobiota bacterium]